MNYDADKTNNVLEEVRAAMQDSRVKEAVSLLRHADAAGTLTESAGLVSAMKTALGQRHVENLVSALASDPCPFCTQGREECEDCGGAGYYGGTEVCRPCAGLGLRRCSFCNGTALAGYDFVPRGLRPSVMKSRLQMAENQIESFLKTKVGERAGAKDLAKQVLAIDRCRGILANAAEQVQVKDGAAHRAVYSSGERTKIEKKCRELNASAERAIRTLLTGLAERFAAKAQRKDQEGDKRRLLAHRAKVFEKLSREDGFGATALRTPAALRAG